MAICMNEVDIKPKNSLKFLGYILDNKLNFENHISSICKFAIFQFTNG